MRIKLTSHKPWPGILLSILICGNSSAVFAVNRTDAGPNNESLTCLISAKSSMKAAKNGARLVDVREVSRDYWIAGSINVPLHAVKSKGYWKATPLILVGEGPRTRQLLQACEELKRKGFTEVWVLHGGIDMWCEAGGAVEGKMPVHILPSIEPRVLLQEYDPRLWAVVLVSENESAGGMIEGAVTLPYTKARAELRATVERLDHQKRIGNARPIVVVVAQDTRRQQSLVQMLKGADAQLFLLEGGLAAYKEEVRWQQAMWSKKTRVLDEPASCGR